MPSYAAALGHQPRVSIAELAAVVPGFSLISIKGKEWAIFESPSELSSDFIHNLGGTIILAQRISEGPLTVADIPSLLLAELGSVRGKLVFALRTNGIPKPAVRSLYRQAKKKLRERGRTARYIGSDRKPAFSVQLHDEELLSKKHGVELTVIVDEVTDDDPPPPLERSAWIGRTIGAQDIDAYTKRDMQKPFRDTKVGLLPPKLAQVLLNFGAWLVRSVNKDPQSHSLFPKSLTVYDPFCGTGVIPLECLHRGWTAYASDLSLRAVNGCERNLEWLRKEEKILKKDVPSAVWKQDALKPFRHPELCPPRPTSRTGRRADVIVTETTLGPALLDRPDQASAKKMRTQSEKTLACFLENVTASLPGTPIVMAMPFWRLRTGLLLLEHIWDAITEAGYEAVLPEGTERELPERPSLLYRRPDQFVGREIVLLKPKHA